MFIPELQIPKNRLKINTFYAADFYYQNKEEKLFFLITDIAILTHYNKSIDELLFAYSSRGYITIFNIEEDLNKPDYYFTNAFSPIERFLNKLFKSNDLLIEVPIEQMLTSPNKEFRIIAKKSLETQQ